MHLIKLKHFIKYSFEKVNRHDVSQIEQTAFSHYTESNWEMNNYRTAYINVNFIVCISDIEDKYLYDQDSKTGTWAYAFYVETFNGDVYWVRCEKRKYNQINELLNGNTVTDINPTVKKKQHL